jgi:hypothetical protein
MKRYVTAAEVGSSHDLNGLVKHNAEYGQSTVLRHIKEQTQYEDDIKNYDKKLEMNPSDVLTCCPR